MLTLPSRSCERENKWLDEVPYTYDTAVAPRGGRRRRKSMEPRSLLSPSGSVRSPSAPNATPRAASHGSSPARNTFDLTGTPGTGITFDRRKSTTWVRSPASSSADTHRTAAVYDDDATLILSPVPPTPAPETISAYADAISADDDDDDVEMTPYHADTRSGIFELMQKTAPAKRVAPSAEQSAAAGSADVVEGGAQKGVLMQRLLLARRKSLQWAPKVGSPLARGAGSES